MTSLSQKQFFSQNELVCRTFDLTVDDEMVDAIGLVALLNSPALEKEGRAHVWKWLRAHPPDFAAFSGMYRWKGDEAELAEFLLVKKEREAKQRLLEAAQSDVVAFAVSYEFLKEIAESEIFEMDFACFVLSLDFKDRSDAIVAYLGELFGKEGVERERVVKPLVHKMKMRLRFVSDLLDDGGPVKSEDIRPLLGGLKVVQNVAGLSEHLAEEIARLRPKVSAVGQTEDPVLDQLARILND
jgi:hypothetical protein